WAAGFTRAGAYCFEGGCNPFGKTLETFFGKAGAAGVAVVDKDRGHLCVLVEGSGYTTDIPTVTGGNQWQQTNGGMFSSVQRAGNISRANTHCFQRQWVDGIRHRAGAQALLRKIQWEKIRGGAIGKLAEVADDLVGDFDIDKRCPYAATVIF